MGILLLKVLLAVAVVAHLLEHGGATGLLLALVLLAGFLRVGTLLLNDELLA